MAYVAIVISDIERARADGCTVCSLKCVVSSMQKKYRIVQSRLLNEIDSGSCTGMTYKQVAQRMPDEVCA